MSVCLHCDIHDIHGMLEGRQGQETDLQSWEDRRS
jgi:hypothetical protein